MKEDKLREILNSLYQDANAMTMFDATIANFSIRQAIKQIKQYAKDEWVLSEKKLLDDYIPEVYCDVIPDAIKVWALRKDGTLYTLRQDNGKELAKVINSKMRERIDDE